MFCTLQVADLHLLSEKRSRSQPTGSGSSFVDSMDLIEISHHDVNADRDPDLGLHGIGAGGVEGFDPQVLLDPFEEQFDMPPALVDGCDGQRGKFEVIGQESQRLAGFGIDVADTTQSVGVECFAFRCRQTDDLIAPQARRSVDRIGVPDIEAKIAFGPRDKKMPGLVRSREADRSRRTHDPLHKCFPPRNESCPGCSRRGHCPL